MFLFLLGCRDYFDSAEEVDSFLSEITNQWWHLENEGSNFYLERDSQSDGGFLWLDFFNGPMCLVEFNVDGGEWQYEPNNKFQVFYEGLDFQIKADESNDHQGCWKVNYGLIRTDIACPYNGECNSIGD